MKKKYDVGIWTEKGATLSHKNAAKEYRLEEREIVEAMKSGILHYKISYAHGNPYYKLIRKEIEDFIEGKEGGNYLENTKLKYRLDQIEKDIRKLKRQIKKLEKEEKEILLKLENQEKKNE